MRVFCSTVVSDDDIARVRSLGMGVLIAATSSNYLPTKKLAGIPICVDNGAFGAWKNGYWFNEYRFLRTLDAVQKAQIHPEWIVAPDIVAGGAESLNFSLAWCDRMPRAPLALAVQDGMDAEMILPHVHRFVCIFIGGTVDWKWQTAGDWAQFAHEHGLQCHIGRASETEDLHRAEMLGADSADSSSINRGARINESGGKPGAWNRVAAFIHGEPDPDIFDMERAE